MTGVKRRLCSDSDILPLQKELDEVLCPICMDHPHNAVLLICSSHEKGCRSYICDTSYRHSNCLDRFKKMRDNSEDNPNLRNSLLNRNNAGNSFDINLTMQSDMNNDSQIFQNEINFVFSVGIPQGSGEGDAQDPSRHLDLNDEGILETVDSETLQDRVTMLDDADGDNSSESKLRLKCPLCRGTVLDWEVIEEARNYLNMKKRSCSRDSCSFVGNYIELRRHARRAHPTSRPSDVDPARERAWQHFEHQREFGDIVSAIQSAMPDAVLVGDYVLENGDSIGRVSDERERGMSNSNEPWLTTRLLFQMIDNTMEIVREPRPRSSAWTRNRRRRGDLFDRQRGRYLWGENLLGLHDNNNVGDVLRLHDLGEDASRVSRRRRRRLTRTRFNENQP